MHEAKALAVKDNARKQGEVVAGRGDYRPVGISEDLVTDISDLQQPQLMYVTLWSGSLR